MIQRDFILRQIEEWARAIGTILGLRKAGDFVHARQEWNDLWQQAGAGMDPDANPEDFLALLEAKGPHHPGYLVVLGNAMWEKLMLDAQNPKVPAEKLQDAGKKTLHLLLLGIMADTTIYRQKELIMINRLLGEFEEAELSEKTNLLAQKYQVAFP